MSMSWQTKNGPKHANYFGSLTQASTCRVGGHGPNCVDTFVPFSAMLPMVHPNDIVVGGWDISSMNLADSMRRSKVRSCLRDFILSGMCVTRLVRLKSFPR